MDADRDGYTEDEDCDDDNPEVNPAAFEVCDGIDNDCNGDIDDDDSGLDVSTATGCYWDADGDLYGDDSVYLRFCDPPPGCVADGTDCDDTDDSVNPGATEEPGDGVDNDCDPSTSDLVDG